MQGDVYKILTNRHEYGIFSCPLNSTDNDLQWEGDPKLPPIGTRVRRGPCWPFSNQDSCMPGTVVGYRNGCKYSYIKKKNRVYTFIVWLTYVYLSISFYFNSLE